MITSNETGIDELDQPDSTKIEDEVHLGYCSEHHPLHIKCPCEAPEANSPLQ